MAVAALVGSGLLLTPSAQAASSSFDFEGYSPGINGQRGWTLTDTTVDADFSGPAGPSSFEGTSLRYSNVVNNSGGFGQVYSPPLSQLAGDSGADNAPTGSKLQAQFVAEFDVAAAAGSPGGSVTVSPTGEGGSRMSFLNLNYVDDDVRLTAFDVKTVDDDGAPVAGSKGCECAEFFSHDLGTFSAEDAHKIRIQMAFKDGGSNDVVSVFVDDDKVFTGSSWEDYYRYNTESGTSGQSRGVDRLLFRGRNNPVDSRAVAGGGMYFDNLSYSAEANVAPVAPDVTASSPVGVDKTVTLAATDANGDQLTYAVASGNGTIDGDQLTVTVPKSSIAPRTVTYTATDPRGATDTGSVTVTPTKASTATALTLSPTAPKPGQAVTGKVQVTSTASVTNGYVDIYVSGKKVATGRVTQDGKASVALGKAVKGTRTLYAKFRGTSLTTASQSANVRIINK